MRSSDIIIKDKKLAFKLFLLCWTVYFSAYIGRLNYSAAMTVMLEKAILTKSQAGFISMIYFFSYGLGQCMNGFAGDRLNPKSMIFMGLSVSAAMNLIMTLAKSVPVMAVSWMINGYAQSMIWPPIIYIFSSMMTEMDKIKYCVDIVSTQAAGTFASYLLSSLIIRYGPWEFVFLSAGMFLLMVAAIWMVGFSAICKSANRTQSVLKKENFEIYKKEKNLQNTPFLQLFFGSGIGFLLIPIFVHGILKDGVVSWVPTYLAETFDSGASLAILLTTIIPIINLSGAYIGRYSFKRMGYNELKASALFFLIAVAALMSIYLYGHCNMLVTALIISIITASMMAVNTLLINVYPLRFEKQGRVATVSGFLNAVAYIGTAISTYCIGILVQNRGWGITILSWLFITIIALFICIFALKHLKHGG